VLKYHHFVGHIKADQDLRIDEFRSKNGGSVDVKQLLLKMQKICCMPQFMVVAECPPTGWSNKSKIWHTGWMQLYFMNGESAKHNDMTMSDPIPHPPQQCPRWCLTTDLLFGPPTFRVLPPFMVTRITGNMLALVCSLNVFIIVV